MRRIHDFLGKMCLSASILAQVVNDRSFHTAFTLLLLRLQSLAVNSSSFWNPSCWYHRAHRSFVLLGDRFHHASSHELQQLQIGNVTRFEDIRLSNSYLYCTSTIEDFHTGLFFWIWFFTISTICSEFLRLLSIFYDCSDFSHFYNVSIYFCFSNFFSDFSDV